VFAPVAVTAGTSTAITTNFPVDFQLWAERPGDNTRALDRLRGVSTTTTEGGQTLYTDLTDAEISTNASRNWGNPGFEIPSEANSISAIFWNFRRAPGFFDEVCYTGTGATNIQSHNLAAVPELIIVKRRNGTGNWSVYSATLGNASVIFLNAVSAATASPTSWNSTNPTATTFTLGTAPQTNQSSTTNVAYLFASCPGVSKVGSFTGTGATQVINCGFTGGARFVLIKATSTTGNWLVWDSARGIVAGNDPYLALNSTAAEVTNTDWVDTAATGFELSNAGGNLANSSGVSYIFLAIA
jgi:hypothetical protein